MLEGIIQSEPTHTYTHTHTWFRCSSSILTCNATWLASGWREMEKKALNKLTHLITWTYVHATCTLNKWKIIPSLIMDTITCTYKTRTGYTCTRKSLPHIICCMMHNQLSLIIPRQNWLWFLYWQDCLEGGNKSRQMIPLPSLSWYWGIHTYEAQAPSNINWTKTHEKYYPDKNLLFINLQLLQYKCKIHA